MADDETIHIDENIYRTNGFRILGLDITSSNSKINNRISRINRYRERKNYADNEPLKGVFKTGNMDFLLPVSPEPSYNEYHNAKNRLDDVKNRLIDEIFWFWPKSFDSDLEEEVIEYLKNDDYNKAISYWGDVSASNTMNMTSVHNLAVLYHVRALDGFLDGKGNKKLFEDLEMALNYWSQTINSNNFKNFVKERINSINDPRLTEEYVDEIFNQIPEKLLNINIIFIKNHLDSENVGKRKIDYASKFIGSIQNSPFDQSIINTVNGQLNDTLEKLIEKNQESFKKKYDAAVFNEDKHAAIFEYSDEVLPYLTVIDNSLKNDPYARNLLNSTCKFIYYKIPYAKYIVDYNTSKRERFEELLKTLYDFNTDKKLKAEMTPELEALGLLGHQSPVVQETSVNISIKDDDNNGIGNVDVKFVNYETNRTYRASTNSSGSCTLEDLPHGRYSYEAEKSGYEHSSGTITVDDSSNSLRIVLKKEDTPITTSSVDVSIKDEDGDGLKAKVIFTNTETGREYRNETDYSGSCTISDVPCGDYRYEVTKSGYKKYTGTKTIGKYGNSIDVKLEKEKSQDTPQYIENKSSYNKSFFAFVAAVILASLAFYALVNFV
jgi:hypothetical protein